MESSLVLIAEQMNIPFTILKQLIESQFNHRPKGWGEVLHWITVQQLEELCEIAFLLSFEPLSDRIAEFLNSSKVIDDVGFSEQIENNSYFRPTLKEIEEKFPHYNYQEALTLLSQDPREHIQLSLERKIDAALNKCHNERNLVEVIVSLFLQGEFERTAKELIRIRDPYNQYFIKLIQAVELKRHGFQRESDSIFKDLIEDSQAQFYIELILVLASRRPWAGYPLLD